MFFTQLVYRAVCNYFLLQNDDEWLDYENETKDYTGLKIETLKIKEADKNDESDHEINEEGEKVVKVKKEGGPWNRRAGQNTEGK